MMEKEELISLLIPFLVLGGRVISTSSSSLLDPWEEFARRMRKDSCLREMKGQEGFRWRGAILTHMACSSIPVPARHERVDGDMLRSLLRRNRSHAPRLLETMSRKHVYFQPVRKTTRGVMMMGGMGYVMAETKEEEKSRIVVIARIF